MPRWLRRFSAQPNIAGASGREELKIDGHGKQSKNRQLKFSKSANEEREAVAIALPISMHAGQIILLTKMLANIDLVFYDFSTGKPVHTWYEANRHDVE